PAHDDPLRLEFAYDTAWVAVKDMSDHARLWHYQRLARHTLGLPAGKARASHLNLYAAMIASEVDEIDDPHVVAQLENLALTLLDAALAPDDDGDIDDLPF